MSDFIDETYKRVEQVIVFKNMNIKTFEEEISVSNNSIGTAIRRKASFKSNVLNKILNSFPEINPTWLLTGRGDMLLRTGSEKIIEESPLAYNIEDLNSKVKTALLKLLLEDVDIKAAISDQVKTVVKK